MKHAAVLVALSVLLACGEHGHDHEAELERATVATTHEGGTTELFVEYPTLVQGEPSRFAAHLTALDRWRPVPDGRVTVVLTPNEGPPVRVEAPRPPDPAGIFRPVVTPPAAGTYRLAIDVETDAWSDHHDLGTVTVYGTEADATAAVADEQETGAITFLLEQQWRTQFAIGTAATGPLRESVVAYGTLRARPDGEARIVAPVTGRLVTPPAEVPHLGAHVARDQVLALVAPRLTDDTDPMSLALAVDRARRDVDLARQERQRVESLLQREAVPARRVLEARHQEHDAASDLATAEHRLAQFARVQGGDGGKVAGPVGVRSPITGTVVAADVTPGSFVEEGRELYWIVDLERLWLEVQIPEAEIAAVAAATGATLELEGRGEPIEVGPATGGRVVAVGGALDARSRTVPLVLELPNPGNELRVGMSALVQVHTGREASGVVVPADAIVDDAGQAVVYVQRDGEHFERRPITTGVRDGGRVEVREGLRAGERVVTRGAYLVHLAGSSGAIPAHGHAH